MLLACAGVVWAQTTEPGRDKPDSPSQQNARSDVIRGSYIVVLEDGDQAASNEPEARRVAKELSRQNQVGEVTHVYGAALTGFSAEIPVRKVDAVRSDSRVAFVARDREVHASAQNLPTGVNRVDADLSSVATGDGTGAVDADIAILDSGIFARHPDLTVAGGVDCSTDGKANFFSDDNGHGSHVAGTAGAEDNAAGVVGTAPGARLWAVKVLDASGSGSFSNVVCGIDWVTANASTIEVANMSLSARTTDDGTADDGNCGLDNSDPMHQAICASVAAGVPYAVAAGNDGRNASNYAPASYDEVITVSALADYDGEPGGLLPNTCEQDPQIDDDFAFFSNFGPDIDIGAPGVCIESTWKGIKKKNRVVPGYRIISGTSMASPHVTGAAAVYLANTNPTATPDEVRSFVIAPENSEAVDEGHTDRFNLNPEPVLQMDNY